MLILKQLKLNQFLSHEDSIINFKREHRLILQGNSGSGKSSIIDAIIFCLYNQGRVDSRNLIQHGKKFAKVELILEDDDKLYKIIRIITNKGKHELTVLEGNNLKTLVPIKANGTRGIQEYLEKKILHSSYLLFINSIVSPQDNVESFVKQTAIRKKEIILEMINAGSYDEYYEKIKNKITALQNDIYISTTLLENLKTDIADNFIKAEKLEEYKKNEIILNDSLEKIKKEKEILMSEIQAMDSTVLKIEMQNEKIKSINDAISFSENIIKLSLLKLEKVVNADTDIKLLEESIKDIENVKKELLELNVIKDNANIWQEKMLGLINLKPIARDYQKEIEEINRQLIQLMNKNFELCPEIQKQCPVLTKSRDTEVKRLEAELINRNNDKQEYIKLIENYNKQIIDLGEKPIIDNDRINELNKIIEDALVIEKKIIEIEQNRLNWKEEADNAIKTNQDNVNTLKEALLTTEIELKALNDQLASIDALRASLTAINAQYGAVEQECRNNSSLLMIADIAADRLKNLKIKMEENVSKSKETNENIKNLQLLKNAFGPNGIKAILIDYVIPKLEDNINNILSKLSDFRIQLDTQKAGVGEDVIIEGLFITIINDTGGLMAFESYSGSEKMRISFSINEGLALISKCGFRILDETINGLDSETEEKFVEVILQLQQNIDQLICVSHLRSVQDLFAEKITVNKINGISIINH